MNGPLYKFNKMNIPRNTTLYFRFYLININNLEWHKKRLS